VSSTGLSLIASMRSSSEYEEDGRDGGRSARSEAIVNAFLQHKSMKQMQDYLARGRRFAKLDVERLNKDWIIAVRSWLANKHRTKERMMDDLAAELRLRRLEPPYGAVEQELADRSAQTNQADRKRSVRGVAREIGEFMRENDRPLQ
jgi:hypothetical protein